jgi:uncharacterized protein
VVHCNRTLSQKARYQQSYKGLIRQLTNTNDPIIRFYVDADGCPVKNEVYKVARRYGIKTFLVANAGLTIPKDQLFEMVIVGNQLDAADNWIVDHVTRTDIVVTVDILLAARCLEKGARVLDPKGRVFSNESIGNVVANRELAIHLRSLGEITGGPAPFQPRDRSQFLQRLDDLVQAVLKEERQGKREK